MMKAITNEPQHILTIGAHKLHARGLPMATAVTWSEQAANAKQLVAAAEDYDALDLAMGDVMAVLSEYEGLTEGIKNPLPEGILREATTEQLLDALDQLLEVNDPFARTKKARAEQEEKGLRMLAALPPEQAAAILKETMQGNSVSLQASSS